MLGCCWEGLVEGGDIVLGIAADTVAGEGHRSHSLAVAVEEDRHIHIPEEDFAVVRQAYGPRIRRTDSLGEVRDGHRYGLDLDIATCW